MFQVVEGKILANTQIGQDLYLMEVEGSFQVKEGQFFMLKAPQREMTLFRPISILDCQKDAVSFLYSVRGKGTGYFSTMKVGEKMQLHGPYGNGFPKVEGSLALVGGGIGMAPLLLTAKNHPGSKVFIGIRENLYTAEEIQRIKDLFSSVDMTLKIGGIVSDIVDFDDYETVFACGPEVMMRAIAQQHSNCYVSLEKHMGCGVGACLSCSCKSGGVMKKVCQDGPVFLGKEVF